MIIRSCLLLVLVSIATETINAASVSPVLWTIRNKLPVDPKDPNKNTIDVRISFGQHAPQNQWINGLKVGHEQAVGSAGCVTMHTQATKGFDTFELAIRFSSDAQWLRGVLIDNKTSDWASESAWMACLNTVYLDVVSFNEKKEDNSSWFHVKMYEQKPK
ncbi:MAG: hypothetical protein WCE21_02360 [Candidatus Babeliales bacterium]